MDRNVELCVHVDNEKYEPNYRNGVVTVTDKIKLQEDFGIDIETNVFRQDVQTAGS